MADLAGLKVAYLSLETPRPGQASQTHIGEVTGELRRLGCLIDLFVSERGGASTDASWMVRLFEYCRHQLRLAICLRRYDVIFVRAHFMAAPLALLARLIRVPVVQEINGRPDDLAITYPGMARVLPILKRLYEVQLRRADHVVAVTDGLAEWAACFSRPGRVTVVPNGANTQLFNPDGPAADLGYRYIVFVGGLVAWHGIRTMIAATQDGGWPTDVRLVVIGDGPERSRISNCQSHLIVRLGRIDYHAVPSYLRGALAALCMIENPYGRSSTGVAPLKLYEAMACGIPVIASDLPFQGDLVREVDAGQVIPAAEPSRLAEAVRRYAADTKLAKAQGAKGAAYVAAAASWEVRAQAILAVLQRVVERNRRRWSEN